MAPITATPPATAAVVNADSVTLESPPTDIGPLLVATDGSESADAAFVAAQILAARLQPRVNVVTVYEPPSTYLPPPQILALPADFSVAAMDAQRSRVIQQERKVIGADWPVEVYAGEPASTVRRIARDRSASAVITGVSRHGLLDRVFGEETTAHIANLAEVPVLAATPSFTRLPQTVLIAIDLDSAPILMTPLLGELLADASTVYFVNAKPRSAIVEGYDLTSWERMYDEGINEVYERVLRSLDLPGRVSHQLIRLAGSTAKEILSFAQYANVELIILGQRRPSLLHRRFSRGLATQLLRATTCAVLVSPRSAQAGRTRAPVGTAVPAESSRTNTIVEPSRWATRLAELSRRNLGRTVAVEVDDADFGAQAQASGYPFMGADYDHRDDRIEIMLGARGPGRAHLTHSVTGPTSLDVLERPNGELIALRIANARGQVLVSFTT